MNWSILTHQYKLNSYWYELMLYQCLDMYWCILILYWRPQYESQYRLNANWCVLIHIDATNTYWVVLRLYGYLLYWWINTGSIHLKVGGVIGQRPSNAPLRMPIECWAGVVRGGRAGVSGLELQSIRRHAGACTCNVNTIDDIMRGSIANHTNVSSDRPKHPSTSATTRL